MTAFSTFEGADSAQPKDKSRYDQVVRLNGLYQAECIDFIGSPGLYNICRTADMVLCDAERYSVAATHFYKHDKKKTPATIAQELGCAVRTVQDLIESGKSRLRQELEATKSDYSKHPVLRVRVHPLKDGEQSSYPVPRIEDSDPVVSDLEAMSSTLFDAETHFAVCSYYLSDHNSRMTAKQLAEILGLSQSGVRQKLNEARNVLQSACRYTIHSGLLLQHPMFTREDPYHTKRRLTPYLDDRYLSLHEASLESIFEVAAKRLDPRFLIPVMRTRFYDANHKQPLEVIAMDMRLSVEAVEEYQVEGRDRLVKVLREEIPSLAEHPVLRSHQRFQTISETKRDYKSLQVDDLSEWSGNDRKTRLWASVLFNRQTYNVACWALDQPSRGLKKAFDSHPDIGKWTTYSSLVQTMQNVRTLCDKARAMDDAYVDMKAQASKCLTTLDQVWHSLDLRK